MALAAVLPAPMARMTVADPVTTERYAAFKEGIAPLVESLALARSLPGTALAVRE